jgi:hypothetical protein
MRFFVSQAVVIFACFFSVSLFAEVPKPLGLELGKTTLDEFKKLYPEHKQDWIKTREGPKMILATKPIKISALEYADVVFAKVVFDNQKKQYVYSEDAPRTAIAVLLDFPRESFKEIYHSLKVKYNLKSTSPMLEVKPIFGYYGKLEIKAVFVQNNMEIKLYSKSNNHLSTLTYFLNIDFSTLEEPEKVYVAPKVSKDQIDKAL